MLKRRVYEVPAVAANEAVFKMVVEPLTFFCKTRLLPSI